MFKEPWDTGREGLTKEGLGQFGKSSQKFSWVVCMEFIYWTFIYLTFGIYTFDKMVRRDIWAQGWRQWCKWEVVKWDEWTLVQYSWNVKSMGKKQKMRLQAAAAAIKITKCLMGQLKEFGFYSVCIRETSEDKLKNDPILFAFYRGQLCAGRPATLCSHDLEWKTPNPKGILEARALDLRSYPPILPHGFSEDSHRRTNWAL